MSKILDSKRTYTLEIRGDYMVSYTVNAGVTIRDYRGKSTDEKPTEGVPNGSTFYEIDKVDGVNRLFMFDADTKQWVQQ